jgi:peptide/nickel transport system ATP-binding protein
MSDDPPLVEVEGLRKYYETESGLLDRLLGESRQVKAVDGVDFQIGEGETLGLVGESGCGKSTVGRTLLRLEEPTAGSVYYRGDDITEYDAAELRDLRQHAQIIFQNPHSSLNPRLTITDTIGEALDLHGLAEGQTRDERITELLERVGLNASHANRYPHEFSGGQLQRIGIARALAVEPDFIVCDEPVSALDVSVQAQILNLLADLQDEFGLSYLFIAHDLSVVEHIADRIAVMYLGKIAQVDTATDLFEAPQHPYTEALVSAIPEPDPCWEGDRIILEGSVPSPIDPPSGCRFHTRCPRVIPPTDYEFEGDEWRAVLSLRTSLATGRVPGDDDSDTATIRQAVGLPESLSDPRAESELGDALANAAAGNTESAAATLADAFPTPCRAHEPKLRDVQGSRIACHLFDPRHDGGETEAAPSRMDD